MLKREDWLPLVQKLDWNFSYVGAKSVYPELTSGTPWLDHEAWKDWDEPFKTTFSEYVKNQTIKDQSISAVRESLGQIADFEKLPQQWLSALKLHSATLPLAEFAATIGNLRAARFGRDSAWRNTALLGALDEYRHTHIPLVTMHELVKWDKQFDWTHKFYHSNNWVAIAARHMVNELLLASNPIEFAIATNFVFETGFTNLQFVGFAALARQTGDKMFEKMLTSIQTDEARHAQIGPAVLRILVKHDREYAQYLLDKWFWRSWHMFAIVTGFSMDYFTPIEHRSVSFKEFMQEWVTTQYLQSIEEFGLEKPWYWDIFLESLETYHHMVYASAYTYRASVWFHLSRPDEQERLWLRRKYPKHWEKFEPIWNQVETGWQMGRAENEMSVHGTAIIGFCHLCNLVLCEGHPDKNSAHSIEHEGQKYIFCSEPCRWIFAKETEKYLDHKDVVRRVLAGEAPANLIALLRKYMGLTYETWGKDSKKNNVHTASAAP